MSDSVFASYGSQSYRMMKVPDFKPGYLDQKPSYVPRTAIPWDRNIEGSLLSWFTRISYPYRHHTAIPFTDPLRSEVRRFLLSLDAYIESSNPVIPEKDILYGATKYEYADILKKIKRKSFETTWKVEHFAFPDWWDKIPSYHITDIGDIFNYSYLIFWKMEDPDDYIHGFIPVTENTDIIQEFKDSVREVLPDRESFEKIDPIEVLSTISSSMSIERGKSEHKPHYMIKGNHLFFADKIGTCERVILQVSPNNCRDSILVDPAALNTISLIDSQLMSILRVIPGHIHLKDKNEVTRRLRKLMKFHFFLQRDLKKEGITKPRFLLKAMLEVLNREYPDIEIFEKTSFYDDFAIRKDDEVIYPSRGHGLGMANALTTLMQLAIHNLIMNRLLSDIPDIRAKPLILNDDFVVGLHDEYHVDQYWDMEDEVMRDLSLLRAPDKSFLSERKYVLAERYILPEAEYEKESYQLRECLLPLACTNIVHAKEYFRSVQTYVRSERAMAYIDEICNYWGYEFYPKEFSYPYIVGGWRNERIDTVDLSLVELDELEYKPSIARGFMASRVKAKKKTKGDIYNPPIRTLYGNPRIPEEYNDIFDILPMSQINNKYGRILSKSSNEFIHYWDKLRRDRQRVFKLECNLTYEDLLISILDEYKNIQFYPSKMMISHYDEFNIIQKRVNDIYLDPNPRASLISYYNNIRYPFKERFSIAFTNADSFTKKVSSLYSKEVERSLRSEITAILFTGIYDEVYIPKTEKIEEMYLNPFRIGSVASKIDWGKGIPILKKEYYHPLIEEKREVYGRIFSLKDQIMLSDRKISRLNIKLISDYLDNNPDESVKSVIDYLDKVIDDERERIEALNREQEILMMQDEEEPVRFKPVFDGKIMISMDDLYLEPDLIWVMNTNREDYGFLTYETQQVVNDIYALLSLRNYSYQSEIFDLSDIKERLGSGYGPKVSLIIKRLKVLEDPKAFDIFSDGEGSDNDPYGQLWEEN